MNNEVVDQFLRERIEEDVATVNPQITELTIVLRNEIHAPEILAYQDVLIDDLKDKLFMQQVSTASLHYFAYVLCYVC